MKLDSEEQRGLLLNVLQSTTIQGDYRGIKEALPKLIALEEAITTATVEATDGRITEQ